MTENLAQAKKAVDKLYEVLADPAAANSQNYRTLSELANTNANVAQAEALTRIADSVETIITGIREAAEK